MAQVAEHLPSKCKVLNSNSNTAPPQPPKNPPKQTDKTIQKSRVNKTKLNLN
jgi:hypothetical protein